MIFNLTHQSFKEFGEIIKDSFADAISKMSFKYVRQKTVTDKSVNRLFCNNLSKTLLDISDGTAILFIGSDSSCLSTFLLDKQVLINKGIYYYITPLINTADISIAFNFDPTVISIPPHERPDGITPSITPSVVHTLFYHEKEINFRFKGEKHPFWELTYVDFGKMCNEVDGKQFILCRGDIMLFTPEQFHSQYAVDENPVRYLTISFNMDLSDSSPFDGIIFKSDDYLRNLLSAIMSEKSSGHIYSDDLILCYLKEIIISLIRENKIESFLKVSHPSVRKSTENKISLQAKNFVDDNFLKPISVIDVARSIPVSESYISRIFKKSTGESLSRYIANKKLEHAKDLLLSGEYTVTRVAEAIGYSSVHYFSAQFKKTFGISPTGYKDSILNP